MAGTDSSKRARSGSSSSNISESTTPMAKKMKPSFPPGGGMVTIYAGDDETAPKYFVHEEVACLYSPVFKAAFQGAFLEGQTKTYFLGETLESAVGLLVKWLYNQTLDSIQLDELFKDYSTMGEAKADDMALAALWILADRLLIPRLQNAIMNLMQKIRRYVKAQPTHTFPYVWKNTTKGSPLRGMIIQYVAYRLNLDAFETHPEDFPRDMLLELAAFHAQGRNDKQKSKSANWKDFAVPEA